MDRPHAEIDARLHATGVSGLPIQPVVISAGYRVVLAFGALLASVFPLVYLVLIPLTAWGVYLVIVDYSLVSAAALSLCSLTGCLLIMSLLKPLVARPGRTTERSRECTASSA